VGHDVIARAEPHLLQHGAQSWRRPNNAVIQQIDMRQMPGAWEMPAAGALAHVLTGELGADPRIEHMRVAVLFCRVEGRRERCRKQLQELQRGLGRPNDIELARASRDRSFFCPGRMR
jgi:hypothetical protein